MGVRRSRGLALVGVVLVSGGCAMSSTAPSGSGAATAALESVSPAGGATSVSPSSAIVVRFDHAMAPAMQGYVTLHHGGVTDSLVPCTRAWSADSLTLTMTPMAMMRDSSQYTIHVGGGMMDAMGDSVSLAMHGTGMGGHWATGTMMNGGGMMGGSGSMAGQEMGMGWAGGNGYYGMVFTFATQ